jgi:hypothetical protein
MMYQFVRMQDDGRMASITPVTVFKTVEEAKAAAGDLLARAAIRSTSKIVLVEIKEEVVITSSVRYAKLDEGTLRKMFGGARL